jgi:signal transduction histidine kinase
LDVLSIRVGIADDNIEFCQLLQNFFLLQQDIELILTAYNGAELIDKIQNIRIDVLILDMIMPQVDGLGVLEWFKENPHYHKPKVIVFSAFGQEEITRNSLRLGVDYFILKPFDLEMLCQRIKEVAKEIDPDPYREENEFLRSVINSYTQENEELRQQIVELTKNAVDSSSIKLIDKYKPVCGGIAHNIKNEILVIATAIKNIGELCEDQPEVQEELDFIKRSVQVSQLRLRLLLEYFNFSKSWFEEVDLIELLQKVEHHYNQRLTSNIKLTINTHDIKQAKISANFEQLLLVIHELINNSVKVLQNNPGQQQIIVDLKKQEDQIYINIKDSGPGILPELHQVIFKEQIPSKGGLGLGLYLSKQIITNLGGNLDLCDDSPGGTEMIIKFPFITIDDI